MPTELVFGQGRLEEVGKKTKGYGKKALLVTYEEEIMKKLGFIDKVIKYLESEGIKTVIYDRVEPNPSIQTVDTGAELAKDKSCDVVVALGGGSVIDTGKGIAVVATHGREVWDYMGENNIPGPTLPLIAIPTTAGTGSEMHRCAVISFKEKKIKWFMASPFIFPKVAIVDPVLTVSAPSYLTACVGIDVLTHAVEAYTSRLSQPISDRLALQAIELCAKNLPVVVMNGDDLEARTNMALASSVAGIAMAQAEAGNAHNLGTPLGGFFEAPHGAIVGLLLPHVMEYNLFTNLEKYANIARVMGEKVNGLSLRCAAIKAVEAIRNLLIVVGLPQKLRDLGVTKDTIPAIVDEVMRGNPNTTSTRIVKARDVKYLFEKAF